MRLGRLPTSLGWLLFVIAAGAWLAGGLILCESPSSAGHFALLPIFLTYVLLRRPELVRCVRRYHVLYFTALAGMITAYMSAFAHVTPEIRVRWGELPVALYFLGSLHVAVWLIDRGINTGLSAAFGLRRQDRSPPRLYVPKTALRVAAVAAVAGPYMLATFMTHWVKFADNTDPWRQLRLPFEWVRFHATDGARLEGWFVPAAGEPTEGTVILAPGRGLTKACFLPYAKALRDNGHNVLLFDLRGEGGSSGHTRSFGVLEARDVAAAVSYLKYHHPRRSRLVFGFGISQGAAAVIAAAGDDQRIRAVVVDSAFTDAEATLARMTRRLGGAAGWYVRQATLLFASAELGCNLFDGGAVRQIGRISPRPVLICHGQADKISPPAQAERLYASAGSPKRLWTVGGAGHGQLMLYARDEYLAQVLAVFKSVRQHRPVFRPEVTSDGACRRADWSGAGAG